MLPNKRSLSTAAREQRRTPHSSNGESPRSTKTLPHQEEIQKWLRQSRLRLQCRRPWCKHCVGRIPWRRKWLPTPVFLLGESHGERSLAGYSQWGHKELDMTEQLTLQFSYQLWGFKCFLIRPTKTFWNRLSHFILCGCLFVSLFLIYNIVNQLYFNVKKKVNVRVSQVLHLCLLLLPDSSAGKESTCNAGDLASIPRLGR